MIKVSFSHESTWISLLQSLLLAASYVGSLYIFRSALPRDHPTTIKQRFKSVTFICLIAPLYVYMCSTNTGDKYYLWIWLGICREGFFQSLFLTVILTLILFTGPLVQLVKTDGLIEIKNNMFTLTHFYDWNWYRVVLVAPFTEEFIFRACLIPLLAKSYNLSTVVFIAPLFFGLAHLHHMFEQLRNGTPVLHAMLVSIFQMFYTTIFGIYSSFLFLRTRNLMSIVVCHSFCNVMGFPDFFGIFTSDNKVLLVFAYVLGLLSFIFLLFPLTEPSMFNNTVWKL